MVEEAIALTTVPRWSEVAAEEPSAAAATSAPSQQQQRAKQQQPRFPFRPELNARVSLWGGDWARLDVDAVVVPTNERMDDAGGAHETVRERGGAALAAAVAALGQIRMSDAKLTPAFNIQPRNVIHTVGPRYNPKYTTAAVNSLNKCYLNALQAAVDAGLKTVAFLPVHTEERSYPPAAGAGVACRTVRRFLEHYPEKLDRIVLIADSSSMHDVYSAALPLYLPRSDAEARSAELRLPEDTGNEWGETVSAERSIRIGALPGMGADDYDDEEADVEQAPSVVSSSGAAQQPALAEKKPSPDVRAQQAAAANAAAASNAALLAASSSDFQAMLRAAAKEDFGDLDARGLLLRGGVDPRGPRPVAVLSGAKMPGTTQLTPDRLSRYMARVLDPISEKPFTLVYLHSPDSDNALAFGWLRTVTTVFPKRYTANMHLLVVYPTFWLRVFFGTVGKLTFLGDLRDVSIIQNLKQLFALIPQPQLRIPDDLVRRDPSVEHQQATATSSAMYDTL